MLLFREYEHNKKTIPLTELSAMISKEINSLKSAIMKELSSKKKNIFLDDQAQNSILYAYLPENLKQHSGEEYKNLPKTYRIAVVATEIACKIVYDQGVGWLTSLRVEETEYIDFIQSYLKNDHLANDMLSQIESSNLKNKSAYAELIRKTATRELTRDEYFSNFSKF